MQCGRSRSSRLKQSKQSLLEQREETRLTSAAKVMRKKKSTGTNKKTEVATNDMRVHSSHSWRMWERTKTTDQSNLGLHADQAAVYEILYRC